MEEGRDDVLQVVDELSAHLTQVYDGDMVGLYLHGSLVQGDFAPGRSDIDLYLVLSRDPTATDVAVVGGLVASTTARHPYLTDRIEIEAVSSEALQADDPVRLPLLRVSPGEPCHLIRVTRHRLLGWSTASGTAQTLAGPPPADVFQARREAEIDDVVRGIVAEWPDWVLEEDRVGFNAYAVLTMCRSWCHLVLHERLSKLRAALAYGGAHPDDAELTRWAIRWWYRGGTDDEPSRRDEVRDFVGRVCRDLLEEPA